LRDELAVDVQRALEIPKTGQGNTSSNSRFSHQTGLQKTS
jgi:hypothetical protein